MAKSGASESIPCECLDCNTAFCCAKTKHAKGLACRYCKNYRHETSVFFVSEDSIKNTNSNADTLNGGTDASAVVKKNRYSNNNKEYCKMHVDNIKFTNMDSKPHTSVERNGFKEYSTITETNYEDDIQSCVDSVQSGMPISNSTAAQLSAQIMNLPLKDYKKTISGEQIDTYRINDILRRLKEAYDSCTCKICECIAGKPNHSESQPSSKPCDCKVCVSSRRDEVLDGIKDTSCSCEPCECISCAKMNKVIPCDCDPCQCMVCKGMAVRRDKMVIVAPVRQESRQPNCLCAPCDCPRCRQRTLNMSPSRVHEMSTGINRHPNCQCEVCIDDSCQPNGTETCSCETRRHGVIRKPVEKNPHDFDIRRTEVLNNPIKTGQKNAGIRTISMYSAFEDKKYPSYDSAKESTLECNCSLCECIACSYKDKLTNSKTLFDKSLRTLKLPSMDFKACNCSPCECIRCASNKNECSKESEPLKSCSCNICDCLNCEGATKPGNALSRIIPVAERLSNTFEPALQCCWKLERHSDVCHCDLCRCRKSTDKGDVSEEGLYPIKKGELLTPSRMRTDPISEVELLSPSSEYTQLKYSRGQSNVFKHESKPLKHESGRTKPKFTVLNLVPRQRTKKLSLAQTTPSKSGLVENKLNSSYNILRVELPLTTVTNMTQYNLTSTSKTLSAHAIVKTTDNVSSHHKNKTESDETACLYDSTGANKVRECQNSTSTSAASSKLGFQHPAPSTSISKNNARQRPLLKKKVDQVSGPSEYKKEASIKEVSFVPCDNGEQHGGALHDGCGWPSHKTYIYTALPSSNIVAEENGDVAEKPPFNKDDYTLENKFYWKLEHSCSPSSQSYQLLNNETYETALTTLEKSKNFSLELVKLLEHYETANSEFESISKKLKESQDLVDEDFELCSRTCRGINSSIKALNFDYLANNSKNKIPTVESSSSTFVRKITSTHPEKTPLEMKSDTLESTTMSHAEKVSVEKCEGTKEIDNRICSMTESYNSSTTGLICFIDAELMCNKNDLQSLSKQLSGSKEVKFFQFKSPHADKNTEAMALLIEAKLQEIQNSLNEYMIEVRKGKKGKNSHIISRLITNLEAAEHDTKLKEGSTPKLYLIRDGEELKPFEISSDTERNSSSYCNTQASGIKGKISRIISQVITNLEAGETAKLETKLKEESTPKLYVIQDGEACKPIQMPSDTERKSSSYCNTQALEILPNGIKDLLKIPKLLQQTSRKNRSYVSYIPKVAIQFKDDLRCTKPFVMAPAGPNKKCNVKSIAKDAAGTNSEKKVQFSSLRRVSDHSVLIKWTIPSCVKDVEGYEILVDGRAAQKILSPARCMAVVTCLPRSEPVVLTIRTLTHDQTSGGLPSTSISYKPRAKSTKKNSYIIN